MIKALKLFCDSLSEAKEKFHAASKKAPASVFSTVLLLILSAGSILFSGDNIAQKDVPFVDCTAYIDKAMIGDTTSYVDPNRIQRQNAKRIYSVMFQYGMRPEQIFGILGNWKHESGLDPTAVEDVFDESFTLGSSKQRAVSADFVTVKWNPTYAAAHPLVLRNGIGLGQWTNDRNSKLVSYAKLYGMEYFTENQKGDPSIENVWYDLNVQLAFALDTSSVGDDKAGWLSTWKEIGNEEWDGDKEVMVSLENLENWKTINQLGGQYSPKLYKVHPVGENNEEVTIGDNKEDDYYKETDRNKAKNLADAEMHQRWDSIIYRHKPEFYNNNVGTANEAARKEYIKLWKERYRYYLYRETVRTYTKQFMMEWEGIDDGTLDVRTQYALQFFEEWWKEANRVSSEGEPNYYVGAGDRTDSGDYFFHVEEGYASGIMQVMNRTKDVNSSLSKIYQYDTDMSKCDRITLSSRKSLAECAALIAWPNTDASRGNNGTPLYQWVHDHVIEGDTVYMSCDRTICTAVRWSGFDDYYPPGSTLNQIQYLVTSPRWVELDWGGDKEQLQPGDILIRKDSMAVSADHENQDSDATEDTDVNDVHHTIIYIGEYIAKMYANDDMREGSCIVHGSFNERSPAIDVWNNSYSTYHAYRCIYPMNQGESKYVGIGYPGP